MTVRQIIDYLDFSFQTVEYMGETKSLQMHRCNETDIEKHYHDIRVGNMWHVRNRIRLNDNPNSK